MASDASQQPATSPVSVTDFDVIVIGAGIAGIDAAYRIQTGCPDQRYAVLEARGALGGTWDLFRYPGIRSDSDMSTLGFPFEPWDSDISIAKGPDILRYLQKTVQKHGIDRHIRYGQRIVAADWSSEQARWTLSCEVDGQPVRYVCRFLHCCAGFFDYDRGFMPDYPGAENYRGQLVHPQHWPQDLDVSGKRIVVIGSGATAITLLPVLAETAAQVTMLQRSPSFVSPIPRRDRFARRLRKFLPLAAASALTRWKNILVGIYYYQYARRRPEQTRQRILAMAQRMAGPAVDVHQHFNPSYQPWDQRLCFAPGGDLFKSLRNGMAAVVTDRVAGFTADGIRTASGTVLLADIVVSATGLVVRLFGGAKVHVDGIEIDGSERLMYKGLMLDGVPNMAVIFGYTNASWTLKCDLSARYVCRLINRMQRRGYDYCVPRRSKAVTTEGMLDLRSGYVQRAKQVLPQRGTTLPWRIYQNYVLDLFATHFDRLDDGVMEFGRRKFEKARLNEEEILKRKSNPQIKSADGGGMQSIPN